MRRSSDLPRRRPRISGRAVIITVGVLFLVVLVFGRAIAHFYIEYLWYTSLGRSDVFWTQIRAQATLGLSGLPTSFGYSWFLLQ